MTLILANFGLCHTLSHVPGPPPKSTSHISDPPPIFSRPSSKNPDKSPLYKFSLNCLQGVLSGSLLSGRFCLGWFLSFPLLSEYIDLLQQKVKHQFEFHVMIKIISVTSHALDLRPPSQTVTPSRTPSLFEYDIQGSIPRQ